MKVNPQGHLWSNHKSLLICGSQDKRLCINFYIPLQFEHYGGRNVDNQVVQSSNKSFQQDRIILAYQIITFCLQLFSFFFLSDFFLRFAHH